LEEAELLVINKIDLLDQPTRQRLANSLAQQFPHAQIMQVSCVTGEGLEAWFERITTGELGNRRAMDVDYDKYADGEARLGWLNARARITTPSPIDGNHFLLDLATRLKNRLASQNIQIAHLKMTLTPSDPYSGVATTYYRVDSGAQQTGTTITVAPPASGSAAHTVYYWSVDKATNTETTKVFTLFGTYIREHYGSRYYGKAINLARQLTAAYDAVLASHDLLLMPTTPMKAQPLPRPGASREEVVERALEMVANTAPFDVSHHPAMAIPCGMSDGLPVSMMLVGRHFDEPTIYRAAYAFEQAGDWKKM
jgi:Asp-tRNA(Asn)/Glu-tRNA(Gln) amidotransferase A subunit family amidase